MRESISSYIDAIYKVHLEENAMVTTGELAEYMGVSDASASEMLRKLAAKGFVTVRPYRGAYLTRKGINAAMGIAENFKAVSLFYSDVLKISNPELAADYSAYALPKEVTGGIMRYIRKTPAVLEKLEKFRKERMGKVALLSKVPVGAECRLLFYFGPDKGKKIFRKRDVWPFDRIRVAKKGPTETTLECRKAKFSLPSSFLTRIYVLL